MKWSSHGPATQSGTLQPNHSPCHAQMNHLRRAMRPVQHVRIHIRGLQSVLRQYLLEGSNAGRLGWGHSNRSQFPALGTYDRPIQYGVCGHSYDSKCLNMRLEKMEQCVDFYLLAGPPDPTYTTMSTSLGCPSLISLWQQTDSLLSQRSFPL